MGRVVVLMLLGKTFSPAGVLLEAGGLKEDRVGAALWDSGAVVRDVTRFVAWQPRCLGKARQGKTYRFRTEFHTNKPDRLQKTLGDRTKGSL
eukprot:8032927-Pyramimonas_sp.AAC.2